jgi:hypothetical protein
MIITDLNHLELVAATNVVGGAGEFDYSTVVKQYLESYQDSYAEAYAESQFGDATATAVSYNAAEINQEA